MKISERLQAWFEADEESDEIFEIIKDLEKAEAKASYGNEKAYRLLKGKIELSQWQLEQIEALLDCCQIMLDSNNGPLTRLESYFQGKNEGFRSYALNYQSPPPVKDLKNYKDERIKGR